MSKRRKFSEEFKREAVGLTQQPGAGHQPGGSRHRRRRRSIGSLAA
jgi:transposase-like protein